MLTWKWTTRGAGAHGCPPVVCRPLLTRAPSSPNRGGTTKTWLIMPALMGLALFGLTLFKNDEGTSVAASPRRLQEGLGSNVSSSATALLGSNVSSSAMALLGTAMGAMTPQAMPTMTSVVETCAAPYVSGSLVGSSGLSPDSVSGVDMSGLTVNSIKTGCVDAAICANKAALVPEIESMMSTVGRPPPLIRHPPLHLSTTPPLSPAPS